MRTRLAAVALLAVALAAGCDPDVDPDLYQRVAGITDCNELGRQAAATDELVDWHLERGDTDQAQEENDYLAAIAKRMEELRC